jgi:hypothetical protein
MPPAGWGAVVVARARSPPTGTKSSPTTSYRIHPNVHVSGSEIRFGNQRKNWISDGACPPDRVDSSGSGKCSGRDCSDCRCHFDGDDERQGAPPVRTHVPHHRTVGSIGRWNTARRQADVPGPSGHVGRRKEETMRGGGPPGRLFLVVWSLRVLYHAWSRERRFRESVARRACRSGAFGA